MHYYQFNIADYRKDTQHLTPIEHYIYRELLDWHYLDEKPIPKDTSQILRRLRLSNDHSTDVEQVLNEYWTEANGGYIQERVLQEINEYKRKKENAAKAGRASAKARKVNDSKGSERTLNDCETTVQPTINHKPLTNNQLKDKGASRKRFAPPTTDEVHEYAVERGSPNFDPNRFLDYYQAQGWKLANGRPMADWKAAVRTWLSREQKNGADRPTGNPAAAGQKLTPAQRVERARLAAAERQAGNTH